LDGRRQVPVNPTNPRKEGTAMANLVTDSVKVGFAKTMEGLFQTLRLPYFKGGSRRFGYNCEQSDTDFFVYGGLDGAQLIRDLEAVGFSEKSDESYYSITEGLHTLMYLPGTLHVVILFNRDRFEELRRMHEKVDRLFINRPNLKQVAIEMRNMGLKGSNIFQLLYCMACAI